MSRRSRSGGGYERVVERASGSTYTESGMGRPPMTFPACPATFSVTTTFLLKERVLEVRWKFKVTKAPKSLAVMLGTSDDYVGRSDKSSKTLMKIPLSNPTGNFVRVEGKEDRDPLHLSLLRESSHGN